MRTVFSTRFRVAASLTTVAAAVAVAALAGVARAQQSAAPARPALLAAGTLAPDFSAPAAGSGKALKLSDYRGKVVILDFWATWCGPCQASMPHLEKVTKAIKGQDVAVVALCVSDTRENYDKWLVDNKDKYSFTLAFDPAGRDPAKRAERISGNLYKVSGIPTTYIIGKDGKIVEALVGFGGPTDQRLEAALKKAGVSVPE